MSTEEKSVKEAPKVLSRGRDHWKVLIRLTFDELLDNRTLLAKLFEIKKHLSEVEGVPLVLLNYDGIVERRQLESEMQVIVRIVRLPIEKGEPEVHFFEKLAADGTPYSDMKAVIDLYPFDTMEQIITLKKILAVIQQAGVAEDMINPWFIRQKVRQVSEAMRSLKNIPIAIGSLPDIGEDAKVEFFFPAVPSEENSMEYYGSRRVKKGDLICRKIPPKEGQNSGISVKGKVTLPRQGIDVELKAQKGVGLSIDQTAATAEIEGMVVVKWVEVEKNLLHGKKVIPTEVQLRVNPILKIKGDEPVNITTDHAVEVEGNLTIGSRIITNAEVHISGSVQEGSVINALEDITVEGDIAKSSLNSEMNILTQGNISDSKIVAKNKIIVGGEIRHTHVVGKDIRAKRISGSSVFAENALSVECLDDDESEVVSSISVGVQEFLHSRYEENREFLEHAKTNLDRIVEVIREPFTRTVTISNVQQQWVKFCSQLKNQKKTYTRSQLSDLKTLFQNIPTLRTMIQEKEEENRKIEERMSETSDEEAIVVVRERVGKPQSITIGDKVASLDVTENGIQISKSKMGVDEKNRE